MKRVFLSLAGLASLAVASPAAAQGTCSRELLQGIAGDWVAALKEGLPFKLKLGEWVEFWQDMERGSMSAFFDKPREVLASEALLDVGACKVFVEAVVVDPDGRRVIGTQLSNGFFGVSPIYNIVPEKPAAGSANREAWPAPVAGQSREQLMAAAEEYLGTVDGAPVIERQYAVDEQRGAVNVLGKAGPDQRATSITMFVQNGKVASASRIDR